MVLLRRFLESLKNYFHLWGLQKSLGLFLYSPPTAQLSTVLLYISAQLLISVQKL
jgi:hypothetical protein